MLLVKTMQFRLRWLGIKTGKLAEPGYLLNNTRMTSCFNKGAFS